MIAARQGENDFSIKKERGIDTNEKIAKVVRYRPYLKIFANVGDCWRLPRSTLRNARSGWLLMARRSEVAFQILQAFAEN